MMSNRILPSILGLLLTLSIPLYSQVADETNSFRLAQVYEQAGKYEDALRYYQTLYAARPANPAYFDGVRRMLMQLKQYPEAIVLLRQHLATHPRDISSQINLGTALLRGGDQTAAFGAWEDAIALQPDNPGVYQSVSDQALDNRLYDKAVDVLLRGRAALKNRQLFVMELARAYSMNMKFDEAMREYVGLLIEQPGTIWQVQQQIAQFSEIPQALSSALRISKEAASEHSSNAAVRYLLSWLYMEGKDYASARVVYAEIDKIRGAGGGELFSFAQRAYSDKAYEPAMKAFRDVAEDHPTAGYAAEAEYMHARCAEALAFDGDIPDDLSPPDSARARGSEAVSQYRGAISLYQKIVRERPGTMFASESSFRIAWITFTRFADADAALALLTELAPQRRNVMGRVDAYALMGDVHVAKGDLAKAAEVYTAVLRMGTQPPEEKKAIEFKLAEILYFQGKFEEAAKALEPLYANSSDDIANDALSLSLFIQQFRAPSEAPLQRYAQAAFLERRGRLGEAAVLMKDIIDNHNDAPLSDQAWMKLGSLQREMGRPNDAIATYTGFLDRYADSILRDQALFSLGSITERDLHDAARAMEIYQRLLNEHPASIYATHARERILVLRKGQS